jgi:hypothetical protein
LKGWRYAEVDCRDSGSQDQYGNEREQMAFQGGHGCDLSG